MSVLIETSLGNLVVDLNTDECLLTCKNFLKLCKMNYYNGCLFHTVQKDFIAQTGDPSGTGKCGDSIYKFLYGDHARFFMNEIHPNLKHSKKGTIAMASAGENRNASQFYLTLRDDLDGKHAVFGEVAEGLEVLSRINEAFVDGNGKPLKDIRIKHTDILYDPPRLILDDKVSDEEIVELEEEEVMRGKEAHSSESLGDNPEAFRQRELNSVTEDDDLTCILYFQDGR